MIGRSRTGPIFRWHDEVLSILWLYNRTGDGACWIWRAECMTWGTTGKRSSSTSTTPGEDDENGGHSLEPWCEQRHGDEGRPRSGGC